MRKAMNCQVRIKAFILLVSCIVVTSIFYCYIGEQRPLENIYENNLSQSIAKIKKVVVPAVEENRNYYLSNNYANTVNSEEFNEKYLENLGFIGQPRYYPDQVWTNVSLPVFVTAIKSGESSTLKQIVASLQDYYSNATLIVFDLSLDEDEVKTVKNFCNSSVSCSLRKFEFKSFPSHVRDLKLFAFRPIIMQDILQQAGAVLWLDSSYQITPSAFVKVPKIIEMAKKDGIKCWTIDEPTTAMTHPRMFDYFHTSPEKYYFHRMIEPNSFILYNVETIHKNVMLPWVKCALVPDCISPIGAQSYGCRYDKKPLYRYSGCHHYDMSALSILLGLNYNYQSEPYSVSEDDKFFRQISPEEIEDARMESSQRPSGIRDITTLDSNQAGYR